MNYLYVDEKGPQETIRITHPFDEDRKIKLGNDDMRVYIADMIKVSDDVLDEVDNAYKVLEGEYISTRKFSLEKELKGKDILKGNFQYGIASLKRREIDFYTGLFKLLIEKSVDNLLFAINKMSLVIDARLVDWILDLERKRHIESAVLFKYSLVKYCEIEACEEVIQSLFNANSNPKDILTEIQKDMTTFVENNKKNRRMEIQLKEYKRIIKTIRRAKYLAKKDFFEGVFFSWDKVKFDIDLWFTEHEYRNNWNLSSFMVILDEGIPSQPFDEFNFASIRDNENSIDHTGLRIADMLVTITGNYISRLVSDSRYDKENPEQIKYLSSKWFELDKDQFNLVHLMADFLFRDDSVYGFVVDTYFDDALLFETFCHYIKLFDSFEKFKQLLSEKHTINLLSHFKQIINKKWQLGLENERLARMKYGDLRTGIKEGVIRPI
ncbi:MAG: hypothetical protein ABF969_01165 [Sporolactobacillus sp.]